MDFLAGKAAAASSVVLQSFKRYVSHSPSAISTLPTRQPTFSLPRIEFVKSQKPQSGAPPKPQSAQAKVEELTLPPRARWISQLDMGRLGSWQAMRGPPRGLINLGNTVRSGAGAAPCPVPCDDASHRLPRPVLSGCVPPVPCNDASLLPIYATGSGAEWSGAGGSMDPRPTMPCPPCSMPLCAS